MAAKRSRLDPVSCQLCRSKKLRCSRQHPCSNCSARGVTCTYAADPPPHYRSNRADDPTVNARLKRLEEAVEALSKSALPPLTPASADSPAAALDWLEDAGIKATNQHVRASDQAGGLSFAVVQIEASTEALPSHSFLPTREETLRLFAHYNKQVGYLHHIIHTETTLATICQIYDALPDRMNHASAALLLAILASASHFWDPTVGIFNCAARARSVSRIWLGETLKTLDQSRCSNPPALEDVQATIIASYLAYNMQGYSAQFRLLQTTALELARQASLHKTDAPGTSNQQPRDPITDEVKRRVWWHIVSTDWLLSFTSGPQEGTYLVQPRHMSVSHPLNANDSPLNHPTPFTPHPLSVPTTMSFSLHRLRFATICRTVADALPALPFALRRADPATIRRLDALFARFLAELPAAFRIDDGGGDGGGGGERDEGAEGRVPRLSTQRYLLHLCAHVRRCKLHQPWLVLPRGADDPERGFSRRTCLASARAVVGAARLFEADEERRRRGGRGGAGEGRLSTVVHHVAMAAVVLVVDLCFSEGGDAEREGGRREIERACKVLERARRESEMAARFLKSLGEMLRRHGVDLGSSVEENQGDVAETRSADVVAGGGDAEFEVLLQNCANMGGEWDFSGWEDVFASFNSYPAMVDLAF